VRVNFAFAWKQIAAARREGRGERGKAPTFPLPEGARRRHPCYPDCIRQIGRFSAFIER